MRQVRRLVPEDYDQYFVVRLAGLIECPVAFTDTRETFYLLRLRPYNPNAALFYKAIGFLPVEGDSTCTHQFDLTIASPLIYDIGQTG